MGRWFVARNGLVLRNGRIVARVPALVTRPLIWLYWDVWWPSWLSWRMTCNPRLAYLVSLLVAGFVIWLRRQS